MQSTNNINIAGTVELPSPDCIREELPVSEAAGKNVIVSRQIIKNILDGEDKRLMAVVGPCSIHDYDQAMEYAQRLKELTAKISDRIVPVMRLYFEKPRTVLGWKGLIYDPYLNDSGQIEDGLRLSRKIMLKVNELGLPTATELLEPIIPQYLTDLLSWAAIGARTTESQTHRQMASGLSTPIGFKNGTDGSMSVAIQAIKAAKSPHTFIGITGEGKAAIFKTKGNKYAHLVLRGGKLGPNYDSEYVAFARELMIKNGLRPNIMIDCSHANSNKMYQKQLDVLSSVTEQRNNGAKDIVAVMLESNLKPGNQKVVDPNNLEWGVSITDACLGWEATEDALLELNGKLSD